jgi:hypothetical protein
VTARKVGNHVELDEVDARAGQTGMHLRQILIASTLLLLLGLAAALISGLN